MNALDRLRAKRIATAAGGLLAAAAVIAPAASAETYQVNLLDDGGDGTCDATCTLRDAVNTANNHINAPAGTADVVTFGAGTVGDLQLSNSNFAIAITNDSLDIVGPGADKLNVHGGINDRIFKLFGFNTADEKVNISGLTLSDGNAQSYFMECDVDPGDGGAILSTDNFDCDDGEAAALTLSKVSMIDNEAEGGGGAVAIERNQNVSCKITCKAPTATGAASLTVHQSTISANDAGTDGGGIVLYPGAGELAIDNTTIVDNNANGGDGGGIDISSFQSPTKAATRPLAVDNTTVSGNDASGNGGGIATDANLSVTSTILAGNTVTPQQPKASTPSDVFTSGATITAGYSLFGTTTGATLTPNPAGSNQNNQNPQLGPLQENGGPTKTELPATTSPAIDAGTANGLSVEQRDTARTIDRQPANRSDGTDVGAVEIPADPPIEEPVPPDEPTPIPGPAPDFCFGRPVILTKGGDADEKLTGFSTDDGIFAGGGQDLVLGIGGDDCLYGMVGDDKVLGGPGNDNANGDRDDDTVIGEGGDDSVRGQNGNDRVFGGPGNDPKVTGGPGNDYVSGGSGDDFVKGDGGNDIVNLGGGKDFVHSGGGADVILSDDGEQDTIICGTGKDVANVDPIDKVDDDCNTVNVINGSRRP